MAIPTEFTPDMTREVLNSILGPIQQRGEARRGRARGEALSRGLEGDPYESSAIGLADATTSQEEGKAISDFNYNLANLGREDRQRGESRGWQVEDIMRSQGFQSSEADKDRAFRQMLSREANEQAEKNSTNELWGTAIGGLSMAAGSALGGPIGGVLAKGLGDYFKKKTIGTSSGGGPISGIA